jgi:ADP-heptose:LPS heptosyltransferase
MALPAIRQLVASLPDREVRLVGRPLPAKVLDGQGPWAPVDADWRRAPGSTAVLLGPSMRVAIGAWRARARIRVGAPTDFRRLLLTDVVDADVRRIHQREVYLRVVRTAIERCGGRPAEAVDGFDADDDAGAAWLARVGQPRWLLHPWAEGSAAKRWPLQRWVELGRSLDGVVVTGGPGSDDADFARRLATALACPVAAGSDHLAVRAWAGAARQVRGVVLPDTGLAHLCAAAGVRPVVLFGATDPARYAPPGARVVSGSNLAAIAASEVLGALGVR